MRYPDRWESTGVALDDASDAEKRRAVVYYLEMACAEKLLKELGKPVCDDPITASVTACA